MAHRAAAHAGWERLNTHVYAQFELTLAEIKIIKEINKGRRRHIGRWERRQGGTYELTSTRTHPAGDAKDGRGS